MIIQIFITLFISMCILFSCAPSKKFNPQMVTPSSSIPQNSLPSTCNDTDNWRSVNCSSGSDTDKNFFNFISNGTNIIEFEEQGYKINCKSIGEKGIIFKMKVLLNAPLTKNSRTQNIVMQPNNSYIEFRIIEHGGPTDNSDNPLTFKAVGEHGSVNGQKVDFNFIYHGQKYGVKKISVVGNINANSITGTISFDNSQYWDSKTPGAKGVLGNFNISSCAVFIKN